MASYQRKTVLTPPEAFELAADILSNVLKLSKTGQSDHEATFTGEEGTVALSAHRHGPYTSVTATTDKLRTSRLDYEVQRILSWMPYEPGDKRGPASTRLMGRGVRGSKRAWSASASSR